jgi:hypothetical protein
MTAPAEMDFAKGLTRAVLEDLVDEDPLVARALDLIFRLEEMAPEVAAWRELPPASRGPMPPIAPARELAVRDVLAEMHRVSVEMAARDQPLVH